MKRLIISVFIMLLLLTGCQTVTRSFGGSTTIHLEPNTKLEEITWKDNSLWYLTKPMTDDDIAETHTFQQQSNFGVFEGTVTIIEYKGTQEEVDEYHKWNDYYPLTYDCYLELVNSGITFEKYQEDYLDLTSIEEDINE